MFGRDAHCEEYYRIVIGFLGCLRKSKGRSSIEGRYGIDGKFPDLAPKPHGDRTFLPAAKYTLSKEDRTIMLQCLKSIKVPPGYSSNISAKVSMKDLKLIGLKSHV